MIELLADFSRGLTRRSIAGLLVVAAPLTWLVAVSQASAIWSSTVSPGRHRIEERRT